MLHSWSGESRGRTPFLVEFGDFWEYEVWSVSHERYFKVGPKTKKVKMQGFSWKFGKIKNGRIRFDSHKASGVNPASFFWYEAFYF